MLAALTGAVLLVVAGCDGVDSAAGYTSRSLYP